MTSGEIEEEFCKIFLAGGRFIPDRFGLRRILFRHRRYASPQSLHLDPPEALVIPWPVQPGQSATDAFFALLKPFVSRHAAFRFAPAWTTDGKPVAGGSAEFDPDTWNRDFLHGFSPGGMGQVNCLVLVMKGTHGILVFELNHGLEIAFYGDSGLWSELAAALHRPVEGTTDEAWHWICHTLFPEIDTFEWDALGKGRTFFESAPGAGEWMPDPSFTERFFQRLAPFMARHASFRFCTQFEQEEYYHICSLVKFDEATWSPDALRELAGFALMDPARMGYILGEMEGLLHFILSGDSFGIYFQGNDVLWSEIQTALQEGGAARGQ